MRFRRTKPPEQKLVPFEDLYSSDHVSVWAAMFPSEFDLNCYVSYDEFSKDFGFDWEHGDDPVIYHQTRGDSLGSILERGFSGYVPQCVPPHLQEQGVAAFFDSLDASMRVGRVNAAVVFDLMKYPTAMLPMGHTKMVFVGSFPRFDRNGI